MMQLSIRQPRRGNFVLVSFLAAVLVTAAAIPRPADAGGAARPLHGLDPGLATVGRAVERVIVTGRGDVAKAVRGVGGVVTAKLPIVDGVAASVRADRLVRLAQDAAVNAVTADRQAHFENLTYDATTTASNFALTSQATSAWAAGDLGAGVGVAVIDTGVSPMNDFSGRLVHGPDLSGEGTDVDTFGHGTVMAGVIGGSGADSAGQVGGAYTGVAPDATLVAVKTAGANGVVDVSTILQAMHWVAAYQSQYNIRVLSLSWGVPSTQDPAVDPLDYAVERLWNQGIVVVVAAGNSGPTVGSVTKPGDDPVVLTVGAVDDQGDGDPANDSVPAWSSQGPTAQGVVKPDVVAPGRSIVATRSFGSSIETNYPAALISPSYIRGSGTSQATALTSGLVALLLAARPDLTPDQVKELLTTTALPIPGVGATVEGHGRVQLGAALTATPVAPPQIRAATGLGSIEASRGGMNVVSNCNGVNTVIQGEIDVRCDPWNAATWTASPWNGDAWTGVSWKGSDWDGVSWKDVAWSGATWDGVSWKGGTWQDSSWEGSTNWNGDVTSTTWTGVSWKGSTWDGVSWKDGTWTGVSWKNGAWNGVSWASTNFLTAFWGRVPPPGRFLPGERFTPLPVDFVQRQNGLL